MISVVKPVAHRIQALDDRFKIDASPARCLSCHGQRVIVNRGIADAIAQRVQFRPNLVGFSFCIPFEKGYHLASHRHNECLSSDHSWGESTRGMERQLAGDSAELTAGCGSLTPGSRGLAVGDV